MATTSTVPTVTEALLSTLNAALPNGVKAFESWPGADALPEMLVLGFVTWDEYEIASIKSGRKHRQEDWSITYDMYAAGEEGTSPANPGPARSRAFALNAVVEDALANDPKLGLPAGTVLWVQARPVEAGPHTFTKGWAYKVTGRIHVSARLT